MFNQTTEIMYCPMRIFKQPLQRPTPVHMYVCMWVGMCVDEMEMIGGQRQKKDGDFFIKTLRPFL